MLASYLNKLNPYMLYIKIGLLVALFLSGAFVGCKMNNSDCSVPEKARAELIVENATLRKANAEYEQLEAARNAQAAATAAAAEQAATKARAEADAALTRAEKLQAKLAAIEKKQAAAKADPKCRDIMELEVCPVLQ